MSKAIEQREANVLRCLMEGMATKDIAESLGIPEHAVKKDVSVLKRRYNARNRVDLVVNLWKADHAKIGKIT
jgi:DNA-binding NarL/FixJ family response regulator